MGFIKKMRSFTKSTKCFFQYFKGIDVPHARIVAVVEVDQGMQQFQAACFGDDQFFMLSGRMLEQGMEELAFGFFQEVVVMGFERGEAAFVAVEIFVGLIEVVLGKEAQVFGQMGHKEEVEVGQAFFFQVKHAKVVGDEME